MDFLIGDCLELVACKLPSVTWPFKTSHHIDIKVDILVVFQFIAIYFHHF